MAQVFLPDLQGMMEKRISVRLNGDRELVGFLIGFDQFMNIVLDECTAPSKEKDQSGNTKVENLGSPIMVRGNSIISITPLDKITPGF